MRIRIAGLLFAALLVAACGTRLPDEAFVEAQSQGPAIVDEGSSADGGEVAAGDGVTTTTAAATDGSGGGTGGTAGGDAGTTGGDGGGGSGGTTGGAGGPNQASDVGVTPNTITIGNITAENGVLGTTFAPAVRGLRAWVEATNAKGGINGRQIVLKTCDDREDRARALECARRLVEQEKVFAIVAANTRAMGGAAQYLNDQAVPVIGFPITNSYYRYPHLWSVYPFGYARDGKTVGYQGQNMATTGPYRWFKTHLGITEAAVFSYDIDESKQAGVAFQKGMELEGFHVTSYVVSFAAPSFDQAVADMQRRGVQIIFDSMDDGANRKLCDAMERRGFSVKAKVSTVVSFGEAVRDGYNDTCRNSVYITSETVPYTKTSVPAVAEFRQAFARYQPGQPLHEWALEAWAQGMLFGDGLRALGPTPTRKGFEDYLRGLRKYTAGGMMVGLDWALADYSKPTAQDCFSISRWLDAKGGWVEATETFPVCYPDAKQYGTQALEQGN